MAVEYRNIGARGVEIRELVETSDTMRFTGYASVFNHAYRVRDYFAEFDEIVEPGAFRQTLNANGGKVPILKGHTEQIGYGLSGVEDKRGLLVEGEILLDVQAGREQAALIKQAHRIGRPMGLSMGFEPVKDLWSNNNAVRRLKEVKLHEWSSTPFPANDGGAIITDVRAMLRGMVERGELSPEQLRALRTDHQREAAHSQNEPDDLHSISQTLTDVLTRLRAS